MIHSICNATPRRDPRAVRRRCETSLLVVSWVGITVLSGCGDTGPRRFDLSGQVTFDGQAVPAGYIVFTPDRTAGNFGAGAQAEINGGRFQTPPGNGTIGGPHVATIYGFDGQPYDMGDGHMNPTGRPLFEAVEVTVDLPAEAATHDFALPAAP